MGSLGKAIEGFKVPHYMYCTLLLRWNMKVGKIEKKGEVLT